MAKTAKKKKTVSKPAARASRATSEQDNRTLRVISGVVLALFVIMLALSCISYMFTGADDQNVQAGERYGNLLGRAGYVISYAVMNRMGVSAFFLFAIGLAVSAVVVLDKPFTSIAVFCAKMLLWALWLSVTAAYLSSEYSGAWGYRLNEILTGYIGWGLALVLAVFPLAWAIIRFGITPEKLNAMRDERLAKRQERLEAERIESERRRAEMEALEQLANAAAHENTGTVEEDDADNAMQDGQSGPHETETSDDEYSYQQVDLDGGDAFPDDEPAPVMDFSEDVADVKDADEGYDFAADALRHGENSGNGTEDAYDGYEPRPFDIEDRHGREISPENMESGVTVAGDGLPAEGEVLHEEEGGVECTVTVSATEGEIDDDLARRLVERNGEYDPKLDLPNYEYPSLKLLRRFENEGINVDKDEVTANRRRIVETLKNYNIDISHIHSTIGPTVTLYEIIPAPGVKVSKIKNLEDDIALSLSALGIRIIAPIPGKGTIGIEVPNKEPSMVSMSAVISSKKFQTAQMELPVAIGKNISNETVVFDLSKMPHLLMAGATGQGKSVGLNAVITSLLYKKHPSQVKFVLVDPKKVELTLYNKIERHYLAKLPGSEEAIITDTSKVIDTLNSLCKEMDDRYNLLKDAYVRNIKEYNAKFVARRLNPEKGHKFLPYIVLVVDEFADLIMTAGKEIETPIARLAQLARAVGIHLIIATQRPSVNVITGLIKANFPARIAFRVTSKIDSRTILDSPGADQLIGKGDMLLSANNEMVRVQCAFIDTPEVEEICEFIGSQKGYPDAFLLPECEREHGDDGFSSSDAAGERDPKFEEAARIVVALQQGSASVIQRKMSIGFNRAGRIVDQLESAGIIGPFNGSKAREVLIQDEASLNRILYGE